jgi:hypothetical protein
LHDTRFGCGYASQIKGGTMVQGYRKTSTQSNT